MTASMSVEAGWYRDPSGRYRVRWWDGTSWTGHVRGRRSDPDADTIEIAAVVPLTPASVAAETRTGPIWSRWTPPVLACVFAGAAAGAVGAFLPWVKVSGDVIDSSATGIDGDGVITALLALLLVVLFTVLPSRRAAATAALVIGALIGVVAAYDLFDITHAVGDVPDALDASASPGLGLLLTGVAAVAVTVGGALALGEGEGQVIDLTRSARSEPRTTRRATRSSTRS